MIESFGHRGLKRFFEKDQSGRLPPDMIERIRTILSALDAADSAEDMDQPSLRLHRLKGKYRGLLGGDGAGELADRLPLRERPGAGRRFPGLPLKKVSAMATRAPAHPGQLVKDNLESLGLSVAKAAESLGVTRQQLYNVVHGRSGVSPEMAVRLEKAFGGSASMWLRMQMNYDLAKVRAKDIAVKRLALGDS